MSGAQKRPASAMEDEFSKFEAEIAQMSSEPAAKVIAHISVVPLTRTSFVRTAESFLPVDICVNGLRLG